ncbi:MAG: hypothetical protein ISS34_07665 [Candidatus Omnitrophica bacterium]|nr:hypothetical protein [Candidatus Omnitrophota bacterium]
MLRIRKPIILFLVVTYITANTALAGGLSSRLVEVRLKDLTPGKIYSVKESTGKILDVTNTTEDITVNIGIEPEKPVDYNLVPGYEPIPDLSWVAIEKNYFKKVDPGESVKTDILISIPKDKRYAGKKYQVYIYSHTAGEAMMRVGIMGRLLIEIGGDVSP